MSGGSLHCCRPWKHQVDFTILNFRIFKALGDVATSSVLLTALRRSLEHVRLTRKILGLSVLLCMMKIVSLAVNPLFIDLFSLFLQSIAFLSFSLSIVFFFFFYPITNRYHVSGEIYIMQIGLQNLNTE